MLLEAFLLGNAAILTNVCVLPLYPGLIAYLAGNADNPRFAKASRWLGFLVLAGILTLMVAIGALLYLLQRTFGSVLIWLLPIIYFVVIALGVLMILGRNPFSRLATSNIPLLKNPYIGAYVYGLLLGPMTLPCAGPILTAAFFLGAGSATSLAYELVYFLFFGLGFGWPLVLLPLVASSVQSKFIKLMTRHYQLLTRLSGVLLVVIGLFGLVVEWLPSIR